MFRVQRYEYKKIREKSSKDFETFYKLFTLHDTIKFFYKSGNIRKNQFEIQKQCSIQTYKQCDAFRFSKGDIHL